MKSVIFSLESRARMCAKDFKSTGTITNLKVLTIQNDSELNLFRIKYTILP